MLWWGNPTGFPLALHEELQRATTLHCRAHPFQQRGTPSALDLRSRGVASSQRNFSGMPLRGD
jgi:hypothetical protein